MKEAIPQTSRRAAQKVGIKMLSEALSSLQEALERAAESESETY